jgi:hypothetical protein
VRLPTRSRLGEPVVIPNFTPRSAPLEQVRKSQSLRTGKASTEETDAWRKMLYGIAEKVANAAREPCRPGPCKTEAKQRNSAPELILN